MYWTLELASYLEDAPWPATKDELVDFGLRTGAPMEVIENLQEIEDDEEVFESIDDIWPDYPTKRISSLMRTSIKKSPKLQVSNSKSKERQKNPFRILKWYTLFYCYLGLET